jgi:hypothetical protein
VGREGRWPGAGYRMGGRRDRPSRSARPSHEATESDVGPAPGIICRMEEDDREVRYSIREAMQSRSGPCPACGGASVHEPQCPLLAAKRKGFALVLGVPLLIVLFAATSFANGDTAASLVGDLVAGLVGCSLVGLWYRRRLARQRRK